MKAKLLVTLNRRKSVHAYRTDTEMGRKITNSMPDYLKFEYREINESKRKN